MRVDVSLRWLLQSCRSSVHARRFELLVTTVTAVIAGARLTVTGLGRALAGGGSHKHSIKRVDRFVGNRKIHREIPQIMTCLARTVVARTKRPIISVDWTGAAQGRWALVATATFAGRGIPIWFEVYPKTKYTSRLVQNRFLERLARALPSDCRPIIVADAGFRRPFFTKVNALAWGFVVRVRGTNRRFGCGGPTYGQVLALAGSAPQDVPHIYDPLGARAVLNSLPKSAKRRRRRPLSQQQRQALEPWLLATNLWHHTVDEVVAIYAQRMQIEEAFRDLKSHRLGWSFEDSLSRKPGRVEVLLLVGALATFVVVMAGLAAERNHLARHFQANTVRNRRVLSVFQLGRLVLNHLLGSDLTQAWFAAIRAAPNLTTAALKPRGNGWFLSKHSTAAIPDVF